ncbi:hypothetical protein ACHAXA_000663 [Cyclostephanos tholiformis]|uniref:Uncharacterized protein n=1 Tax=Cyclostephanos tholiformis TaxID=382380 RepID=A0ABD3SD31_9STRA
MASSKGQLSPRGRARGRSRTRLPPIPERGLSSQSNGNASGAVFRNDGGVSSDSVCRKNEGAAVVSEPHRKSRVNIAMVESRDDDDSIAVAASKPLHEVVFKVDPELGLPPPPPVATNLHNDLASTTSTLRSVTSSRKSAFVPHSAPSAMSTPADILSTSTRSRCSLKSMKNEDAASSLFPLSPSDATAATMDSGLASITSRNSKILTVSGNSSKLLAPPKPPAAMSPPDNIVSTTTCKKIQKLTSSTLSEFTDGAVEYTTVVVESCMAAEEAPQLRNCSRDDRTDAITADYLANAITNSIAPLSNISQSIAAEEASKPRNCSRDNRKDAITTDYLADAITNSITPSLSNVSRKHISAMVCSTRDIRYADAEQHKARFAKNTAEKMSGKDFQRSRCEDDKMLSLALLCDPNFDPPGITSIPTDEILDSFMNEPTNNHASTSSDEEVIDNAYRETRDQYQLGRLQARIDQRRQIHNTNSQKEDSLNYKTLRSSRIKTARTLYSHKQSHDYQKSSSHSGVNYIHGLNSNSTSLTPENSSTPDLVNKTSGSTIYSLSRGYTIGPSNTSSSSGINSASISGSIPTLSSQELSAQRRKLFMKMINLLNEVSSNENRNDLSIISKILRNENRSSRPSAADVGLIQKLTEDEMSRILNEFEQSNSLIEKKDSTPHKSIPESGIAESSFSKFNIPELMYENIPTSIVTKLSDVTSEYEKEMSPIAEIGVEDVSSPLDAFGSVANVNTKKCRHFNDEFLHAASTVTDSPMHDDDELLEVISILSQYEQAEEKLINKGLIKAKNENNLVYGENDVPFVDKPNEQMCGCATWLCIQ